MVGNASLPTSTATGTFPYAIDRSGSAPRSSYPIGPSLLVIPAVAVLALSPSWRANLHKKEPDATEKMLASAVGAAAVTIFFWLMLVQFRSLGIALITTLTFALGTSMWSTATRALWQHGPLVLMLLIAMLLLARARARPALVQYVSVPLALSYVMRPTAIIGCIAITLYVAICHRSQFLRYAGYGLLVAVPWTVFNLAVHQWILSPYYTSNAFGDGSNLLYGLAGNLFSPSRGLLIFSPVLLFSLTGFLLALRCREQRALFITYGCIVAGNCIVIGAANIWWAGHSYGPRFTTDILPFLLFFLGFNFRLPQSFGVRVQNAVTVAIRALAVVSASIHAPGALRGSPWGWNVVPNNIDEHPARAWDWRDPQFLRRP
jgi:hypothetical protein